jgi:hypothetical protein
MAVKMKAVPKVSTNALTQQAIRVLSLCGFQVWRQNNGGVYDAKIGGYRRNSSTPGISDIIGFHKKTGRFIAVEIKTGKDKLSPYQERFLNDVVKSGAIGVVLKDLVGLTTLQEVLKLQYKL